MRFFLVILSVILLSVHPFEHRKIATKYDNIINPGGDFYSTNFNSTYSLIPGDTVILDAGNYGHIDLTNVNGITFLNAGGVARINSFNLNAGAINVKLKGNGVAGVPYGIKIKASNGYFATDWQVVGDSNEIAYVEVENNSMGFKVSTNPLTSYPLSYQNIDIHHNYIHGVGQEAMYVGRDELGGPFIRGRVYNNYVLNAGRDGIQCRNGTFDIRNNVVANVGLNLEGIHAHGILIGGNTNGSTVIYNKVTGAYGYGVFNNGWGYHIIKNNYLQSRGSAIFCKNYEEQEDNQNVGYQKFLIDSNYLDSQLESAIEKLHENNGWEDTVTITNNKLVSGAIFFQNQASQVVTQSNNSSSVSPTTGQRNVLRVKAIRSHN